MKRILVLTAALLLTFVAQAQIVSSSSRRIVVRQMDSFKYIKAGVAFQSADLPDYYYGPNLSMGFNLEFGMQKPIGGKGFFWGMEVGLGSRGLNYDGQPELWDICLKASPLRFGYELDLSDGLAIDFYVGAFASIDLYGKGQFYYHGRTEKISLPDYKKYDLDFRSFDLGFDPGVTFWYRRVGLGVSYQLGLINFFEGGKSSNVNVSLFLRF